MLEVQLSGSLRDAAGGAASIHINAATIRELFRKIVEQHPRMQASLDEGVAVSINGEIYRDDWAQMIPEGAEIFLLPRIPGG